MPLISLNEQRLYELIKWWEEEGYKKYSAAELWPYSAPSVDDYRNDEHHYRIMARDIMEKLNEPVETVLGCGCRWGTHDNTIEAMKENHKDIQFPELDPNTSYFFSYRGDR